jgi:hypothetical protein
MKATNILALDKSKSLVSSLLKALDKSKSAILASNLAFKRMLVAFTSLWMRGGLQPLCSLFGHAHQCFYSDRLVMEGATRSSVLFCHQVTLVHGEVRGGEYYEGWIGGLANGGSCLCIFEGLTWYSGFRSSMQVGTATQVKFRVLLSG